MGYFPMCIDLKGKTVLLIGNGKQTADREQKLRPFGANLRRVENLTVADLTKDVAFVAVGDTAGEEAARISALCTAAGVPVNVADKPELCTFVFPAMVCRGDLTVSVSTGGKVPGGAAYLSRQISRQLPDRTEEILDWLGEIRRELYSRYPRENARQILSRITVRAFDLGRPLDRNEMEDDCL